MTQAIDDGTIFFGGPGLAILSAAGALLIAAGFAGALTAAWGYGLTAAQYAQLERRA